MPIEDTEILCGKCLLQGRESLLKLQTDRAEELLAYYCPSCKQYMLESKTKRKEILVITHP